MQKKTLLIHAGTHKTGTTSIQHLLHDNQDALLSLGCKAIPDYPGRRFDAMNCASIAHAFIRPELLTPTRIKAKRPAQHAARDVIDWMLSQMESVDCDRYILSAEALCYMRTQAEREFFMRALEVTGCDLVPLLYFRSGAAWKASWLDQIEKEPAVKDFMQHQPGKFNLLDDWYFDVRAIQAFWQSVSSRAVFLDYDRIVARFGSVIPSFLEVAGLPQILDTGRYFLNRRHSARSTPAI